MPALPSGTMKRTREHAAISATVDHHHNAAAAAAAAAAPPQSAGTSPALTLDQRPNRLLSAEEKAARKAAKVAAKAAHRAVREERRQANMARLLISRRAEPQSHQRQPMVGTADEVDHRVQLKDDMGRVYSRAPREAVLCARAHIAKLMQGFANDSACGGGRGGGAAALGLLDKMKKGKQRAADFEDPAALWAYARLKWSTRAMLVFEAFRLGLEDSFINPTAEQVAGWRVLSVGGGPGNDLHGLVLFREHVHTPSHTATHAITAPQPSASARKGQREEVEGRVLKSTHPRKPRVSNL